MRRFLIIILLGITCFFFNTLSTAVESNSIPLIPIYDLMQDPLIDNVVISPDGKSIAALYNRDNRIMVLVKDITDNNEEPVILNVYNHDVKWIRWANSRRIIAGALIEEGLYNDFYVLVVMDKNGKNMRHLIEQDKVGSVIDILPNDPEHVLIEELEFSNPFPEVYKVSVGNRSEERRVQESRFNIGHWMTDANGIVKMGIGTLSDRYLIDAEVAEGEWKTIIKNDYFKDPLFSPLCIGNSVIAYVLSTHEHDKAALYEYDITTQTFRRQLFKHDTVDVDDVYYSRLNNELEYATYTLEKQEIYFFNEERQKEYLAINQALPDTSNMVTSRSVNEKRVIVKAVSDNHPGSYYIFDREKNTMEYLGSRYPDLEKIPLSETKGIKYQSRDGMTIYGFISFPLNFDGTTPLPMVVLVHGGPHLRVKSEYDPWVQFLTNRGYIVFQPNFRGSSGYGGSYIRSGYGQWGGNMQNDIVDGVQLLITNEFVDKTRICIMGASFGGYAALMGVARNSDIFSCAVSLAGISDINKLLIEEDSSYRDSLLIGDDISKRKEISPITHTEFINSPVLLAHGTDDKAVSINQSIRMYKALRKMKKEVTFIKLKDETHDLENLENRVTFFKAVENFLDKHIGKSSGTN